MCIYNIYITGDGVINQEEFYRVMRKRENPLDEIDSDDDF